MGASLKEIPLPQHGEALDRAHPRNRAGAAPNELRVVLVRARHLRPMGRAGAARRAARAPADGAGEASVPGGAGADDADDDGGDTHPVCELRCGRCEATSTAKPRTLKPVWKQQFDMHVEV